MKRDEEYFLNAGEIVGVFIEIMVMNISDAIYLEILKKNGKKSWKKR